MHRSLVRVILDPVARLVAALLLWIVLGMIGYGILAGLAGVGDLL